MSSITAIGNETVKSKAIYQRHRLTNVGEMSRRQSQAQGIAQSIGSDMNLGTEATTARWHVIGLLRDGPSDF